MPLSTNTPARAPKRPRTGGTRCIFPRGLQDRYGVSNATVWRWRRAGRLPPMDVYVGGQAVGWLPETIERADRGGTV
jgi:predicted DNA-binding transcriptional regulator AlpA